MRRLGRIWLAAAAIAASLPMASWPVAAERLVVSLSTNRVQIGSNYTGAQLVLFGIVEREPNEPRRTGPIDLVVTVRGPREALTVRRKDPLGPVWLNRSQLKFVAVPAVLSVVSSRPLAEIASPAVRTHLRLGLDEVANGPELSLDRGGDEDAFRTALIRIKRQERLWSSNEKGVLFVTPDFFRARLPLPGIAPTGNYEVEALLMSGDAVLSRRNASFEVVKSGFEERLTAFSQEWAWLYGLVIAGLSLLFGWIASVIFRRD